MDDGVAEEDEIETARGRVADSSNDLDKDDVELTPFDFGSLVAGAVELAALAGGEPATGTAALLPLLSGRCCNCRAGDGVGVKIVVPFAGFGAGVFAVGWCTCALLATMSGSLVAAACAALSDAMAWAAYRFWIVCLSANFCSAAWIA